MLTIVIDAPADSTGKRRRRWVTIQRLRGETDRQLYKRTQNEQRRLAVERDSRISELALERITVAQFLERWLREYAAPKPGDRTVSGYQSILRHHVIPEIGRHQLQKLRPLDIQALYGSIRRRGSQGRQPCMFIGYSRRR